MKVNRNLRKCVLEEIFNAEDNLFAIKNEFNSDYAHEPYLDEKLKHVENTIRYIRNLIGTDSQNKTNTSSYALEKALDRACEELAMFSGVDVKSPLATAVYKYQCENCKLKNVDCHINGSIDDENCMPSKSKLYWKQYLLKESEK